MFPFFKIILTFLSRKQRGKMQVIDQKPQVISSIKYKSSAKFLPVIVQIVQVFGQKMQVIIYTMQIIEKKNLKTYVISISI